MNSAGTAGREILLAIVVGWISIEAGPLGAQPTSGGAVADGIRILELQGKVEIMPPGATDWLLTQTNQILRPLYRLRTGPNSRVALRWSDQSVVAFGALTEIEILPPHAPGAQSGLHLIKGILSFFHRDKPGRIRVITRGAIAGVEGTELVLAVDAVNNTERTTISVIDGQVRFSNEQGALILTNGQQSLADLGKAPIRTAGFIANNVLQWAFYYPAVLDLSDLPLSPEGQQILSESLAAYRAGDLLTALAKYPAGRQPGSDAERVYYAALLLSVGQVEKTEAALADLAVADPTERLQRLATALRQLIAAVKRDFQLETSNLKLETATELLAASYYEQSRAVREDSLRAALHLAWQAATNSADFGFAWTRVAELEFSFGHTASALEALNKCLALAPRNAQALALKGFLFAAQNKTREAIGWFNQALSVDSALGNAWLGRGLCRIRRGDTKGGRQDLLVAAALEPQRSLLRSYLSKAYSNAGDMERAGKELDLAKQLDSNDPTAWLYSALLHQQDNRINEGIRDLEKSQELNDNRRVYRSQLLLDQDRAVGSANLAALYRDAGMVDVSVREAGRAVSADYANYSAHLFLANSYDQLRDPNRINLRFETPAETEYLIANLLAPVGAGLLAQSISQQEYSKLFERDRLGVSSSTEYLSRGAWTEQGAQFGTFRNSAYALEAFYRTDPGQRPNNDFEERTLTLKLKQQVTPQDSVYAQAIYYEASGGDLIQRYDHNQAHPELRIRENQDPIVSLGYHREWGPGLHTLALASRLSDRISVKDPIQVSFFANRENGELIVVEPIFINSHYRSTLELYSAELQQIWQQPRQTTVFGARFQTGDFRTINHQTHPIITDFLDFFDPDNPSAQQDIETGFERLSLYGYHHWQIVEPLLLVGGVSYDRLIFPGNFRAPPISDDQKELDRVSPKAGLIFTPLSNTVLRAAYTRSLSGASIDQSSQLEPTQVAGFNQSFRSIIPESVGGANEGARFVTYGVSLEHRFPTCTYVGLSVERLESEVDRTLGIFLANFLPPGFANLGSVREEVDYREESLLFTLNQLLGSEWAFGARYRLSDVRLRVRYPEVASSADLFGGFQPGQNLEATLHQMTLYTTYHHASGFFAQGQALWYAQSNRGFSLARPGDDFWQFNLWAGYRFAKRKVEVVLGVLNLNDQDYRLEPLTLYNDLPRERTFVARVGLNF